MATTTTTNVPSITSTPVISSYSTGDISSAYYQQNSLMNDLVDNLHDYRMNQHREDSSQSLNSAYQDTINSQIQMLDLFDNDINRLKQTYIANKAFSINKKNNEQDFKDELTTILESEKDGQLNLAKEVKQHLIYQYYYKKQKAQLRIIYAFIALLMVFLLVSSLNKNMDYVINDTLYVIIMGVSSATFVIYAAKTAYDIYRRNDHSFDEYDDVHWNKPERKPFTRDLPELEDNKKVCLMQWEEKMKQL